MRYDEALVLTSFNIGRVGKRIKVKLTEVGKPLLNLEFVIFRWPHRV